MVIGQWLRFKYTGASCGILIIGEKIHNAYVISQFIKLQSTRIGSPGYDYNLTEYLWAKKNPGNSEPKTPPTNTNLLNDHNPSPN